MAEIVVSDGSNESGEMTAGVALERATNAATDAQEATVMADEAKNTADAAVSMAAGAAEPGYNAQDEVAKLRTEMTTQVDGLKAFIVDTMATPSTPPTEQVVVPAPEVKEKVVETTVTTGDPKTESPPPKKKSAWWGDRG
jgi:hypothetical protein